MQCRSKSKARGTWHEAMKDLLGKLTGDSGWAVPRKARLRTIADGVSIEPEGAPPLQASWSTLSLKQSLMDEAEAVLEAHTADGHLWSFEAPGRPLLEMIRAHAPSGPLQTQAATVGGTQTVVRRKVSRGLFWIGLVFVLIIGGFIAGLAYVPTYLAERFPPEWEDTLGKTTLKQLMLQGPELTSGPAYDAVHKVWDRLQPGLEPSRYKFELHVIDSPIVNACAMPGGYVVVYTGLLSELDSPEALAGILGHEAQHVLRKHSLKSLVRAAQWQVSLGMLWTFFGGGREAATLQTLQDIAGNMDSLAYGRNHESEADRESVKAMVAAHIDPIPFTNFFHVLAKKEGHHFAILATHPPSEDRAAALQAYAKTLEPYTTTPIDVNWGAVKKSLDIKAKVEE